MISYSTDTTTTIIELAIDWEECALQTHCAIKTFMEEVVQKNFSQFDVYENKKNHGNLKNFEILYGKNVHIPSGFMVESDDGKEIIEYHDIEKITAFVDYMAEPVMIKVTIHCLNKEIRFMSYPDENVGDMEKKMKNTIKEILF